MRVGDDLHLAYCTNIHAGESWAAIFGALDKHVMRVRELVCPADTPYAIGLRLSARAAHELNGHALADFRRWLDRRNCYVFTINGFPYGAFHGTRVKEQVYAPDWSQADRLVYTRQLFDILATLLPDGVPGSVSTLPGSFKEFITGPDHLAAIRDNLLACADYVDQLSDRTGHDLHLGLEPEPLGLVESTPEAVAFWGELAAGRSAAETGRIRRRLGLNYDCCHLAVEFEEAAAALDRLTAAEIRLSKIHLSSALRLDDPRQHHRCLASYVEETYLHQVIAARDGQVIARYKDLDLALAAAAEPGFEFGDEWRVHFHIPLHSSPAPPISDTRDHLAATLTWLAGHPGACRHLEMETYTWGVLPDEQRSADVVDQLAREYEWTLHQLVLAGVVPLTA